MPLDGRDGLADLTGTAALVEGPVEAVEPLEVGSSPAEAGEKGTDLGQLLEARRKVRVDRVGDRLVLPVEVEAEPVPEELADGDPVSRPDLPFLRGKDVRPPQVSVLPEEVLRPRVVDRRDLGTVLGANPDEVPRLTKGQKVGRYESLVSKNLPEAKEAEELKSWFADAALVQGWAKST